MDWWAWLEGFSIFVLGEKLGKRSAVGLAASTVALLEIERDVKLGRGLLSW